MYIVLLLIYHRGPKWDKSEWSSTPYISIPCLGFGWHACLRGATCVATAGIQVPPREYTFICT